jgi:hypothetical protein
MQRALAVFVCFVFAVAARAQQPEAPPSAVTKSGVIQTPAVRPGCADDNGLMPYLNKRWPAPAQLYQSEPAGNYARSPNAIHDSGRLTWWFLPTPRAFREAIHP